MFGIIVSGRMVQTECLQVEPTKFLFTIPNADNINHIVVFMTGVTPFPDGMAGSVFFSFPDKNAPPSFQHLGYISNDKPSAIFKITNLKTTPLMVNGDPSMPSGDDQSFNHVQTIIPHDAQIGISVEPIGNMMLTPINDSSSTSSMNAQHIKLVELTTKAAENLFNYCASFSQSAQQIIINAQSLGMSCVSSEEQQFIPLSCIKQWYDNFIRRIQRDPNFLQT